MSTERSGESLSDYVSLAVRGIANDPDLRTLYAVYLLLFVVAELYQQALPLYFRALGIPIAVLGIGKSVAAALEVLASPVSGVAADAYDRFALAGAAGLVLAVAFGVLGFTTDPVALVALMALVAVVRLALNNAMTPAVDEALDESFAGIGWGLRDVAIYLGSALGLALGGVVTSVLSSVGYAFLALVPVLVATSALLWRNRESASGTAGGTDDAEERESEGPGDPAGVRDRIRGALRPSIPGVPNPPVMARFGLLKALSGLGTGMTLFLLPVLAVDLGIGAAEFLFLFSGTFAVSAPLSVLGGVAADRLDRKRLYVGNFLAETAMLAAFGLASSTPLFLVGTGLYVVQTAFEPAVIAFFFDSFDEEVAGTAWGIDGVVSKGTGVVAPAAGAALYGIDPGTTFLVGAALLGGATLVALTLPRPG